MVAVSSACQNHTMGMAPADAPPAIAWFEQYSGFIKFLAVVTIYLCAQVVVPTLSEVLLHRVARPVKEYRLQIGCPVQALPKPRSHVPDCAIPFPVYDGLRCIAAKSAERFEQGLDQEMDAVLNLLQMEVKIARLEEGFRTGVLRSLICGLPRRVWACLLAVYMMYAIPAAVAKCETYRVEDLLDACP